MTDDRFDIIIIGAGPTGLMLATSITRMGAFKIKIVDKRQEATKIGRADGIQARTLDLFENMGLKDKIMVYRPALIYEVSFWNLSDTGVGIQRTGTWTSYPDFIDTRYHFTTILHQGRIEKMFIDDIAKSSVQVDRSCSFTGSRNDGMDKDYPIEVDLAYTDRAEKVRTKYLFGADGARSAVREHLGIKMPLRDPIAFVWSVIDGVVKTTFPDIQIKCTIHSEAGSSMVIPQGNNRVRIYIQVHMEDPTKDPWKEIDQETTQLLAGKIFAPYTIEWEEVDWWSMYPISQRLAEKYTLDHRTFIGGDACHTHSPKAGQGMNYGFFDAQNFSWKFNLVESGFAAPSLLESYEQERKLAAAKLIDFDVQYAKLFSSRPPSTAELRDVAVSNGTTQGGGDEFVEYFKKASSFTSGYEVDYGANDLNWRVGRGKHAIAFNPAGVKLVPGRVFPVATVIRVIDANVCKLDQEVSFNGAFRIYVFAGDIEHNYLAIKELGTTLAMRGSFLLQHSNADAAFQESYTNRHNPHSPFFTFSVVSNNARTDVDMATTLPGFLQPYRYHVYADDVSPAGLRGYRGTVHAKMGFDQQRGGVAIVRPDAFVACVLGLGDGAVTAHAINDYFRSVCGR
ncbi:hypothetical protein P154DRAFT_606517 [Amniculicola lignicola CBS 123094]|uniref:Phenol 2-monooxygenase n=1 Tax=Amniculicola lignicola CBS 123094 TaxID=1392246 RepID=A0A6A5WHW1_9PLEO|nr:hypothetical protein P154DRAFT_606517 [Amniculicola lignicola CBS 123094]